MATEDRLCAASADERSVTIAIARSPGFAVKAIGGAGEEAVTDAVLGAVAPYRTSDGGYRLENVFSYAIART